MHYEYCRWRSLSRHGYWRGVCKYTEEWLSYDKANLLSGKYVSTSEDNDFSHYVRVWSYLNINRTRIISTYECITDMCSVYGTKQQYVMTLCWIYRCPINCRFFYNHLLVETTQYYHQWSVRYEYVYMWFKLITNIASVSLFSLKTFRNSGPTGICKSWTSPTCLQNYISNKTFRTKHVCIWDREMSSFFVTPATIFKIIELKWWLHR